MNEKLKLLTPALCTAAGIMIATLVAVFTMGRAAPLQMVGPLLFAASLLASDVLTGRARGRNRLLSGTAIFLAVTFLFAMWMIAQRSPNLLPAMIAVLGSCLTTPLMTSKQACR